MTTERVNNMTFRVHNPKSGRSQDVIIPGADRMEKSRLDNLVAWQTEETMAELEGPEPVASPHSKKFQHELGGTLMAIEATKRRIKETGHGRYW